MRTKRALRRVALGLSVALFMMFAVLSTGRADLVSTWSWFEESFWVPCANGGAGELVDVAGYWHTVLDWHFDATWGLHITWHDSAQGFGVGQVTGDRYGFSQTWPLVRKYVSNGSAEVVNGSAADDARTIRVIGQGTAPNFRIRALVHTTTNANGDITVDLHLLKADCK